jgi:glycosyltransferase involved in cell wall biosynthesis
VTPILSILICNLPQRLESHLFPLLRELAVDIGELPVQYLYLGDNQSVSVGQKRQMLLDIASGEYVTYLDDDDRFEPGAIVKVVNAIRDNPGVDVVCYDEWSHFNDDPPRRITFGPGLPNTEIGVDNPTRAVWHTMTWKTELARQSTFPDTSYGEDWGWAERLQDLIRSHVKIGEPLRRYYFRKGVSATQ